MSESQTETEATEATRSDVAPDERHEQSVEPERSTTYRVLSYAVDNMVLLAGGFVIALVVLTGILDYQLGREPKIVFIFAGTAMLLVGRPVGRKARELLFDPRMLYIIDVDASLPEAAVYRLPSQKFVEWTVDSGQLDWVSPALAFGKNADPEEQTIEGTWRGSLPDREMMRGLNRVKECRGQLEDDARRGFAIETQAWTIIRNATRETTMSVVQTFEDGSLPDEGEGVGSAVEDAIRDYDLDERIRDFSDESPDAQQDIPENAFVWSRPQGQPSENGAPEVSKDV